MYLKPAGIKGRGVFCVKPIKKGEELETTPAIILNASATDSIEDTILADYAFQIGDLPKAFLKKHKINDYRKACAMVMGIASYCNHGPHPNAEVRWQVKGSGLYYSLVALRDIPAHTEICTSYGEGWFDDRNT